MNAGILGGPLAQQQSLITTLFADTFVRADSPILAGTVSSGGQTYPAITTGEQQLFVRSNKCTDVLTGTDNSNTILTSRADCVASIFIDQLPTSPPATGSISLFGRCNGAFSAYVQAAIQANGTVVVFETANSHTQSAAGQTAGGTLTLTMKATAITVTYKAVTLSITTTLGANPLVMRIDSDGVAGAAKFSNLLVTT